MTKAKKGEYSIDISNDIKSISAKKESEFREMTKSAKVDKKLDKKMEEINKKLMEEGETALQVKINDGNLKPLENVGERVAGGNSKNETQEEDHISNQVNNSNGSGGDVFSLKDLFKLKNNK